MQANLTDKKRNDHQGPQTINTINTVATDNHNIILGSVSVAVGLLGVLLALLAGIFIISLLGIIPGLVALAHGFKKGHMLSLWLGIIGTALNVLMAVLYLALLATDKIASF